MHKRYRWNSSQSFKTEEYFCPLHHSVEKITYTIPFPNLKSEERILFIKHYGCVPGYHAWKFAQFLGGKKLHYTNVLKDPEVMKFIIGVQGMRRSYVRRIWNHRMKGKNVDAEVLTYFLKHDYTTYLPRDYPWRLTVLAK